MNPVSTLSSQGRVFPVDSCSKEVLFSPTCLVLLIGLMLSTLSGAVQAEKPQPPEGPIHLERGIRQLFFDQDLIEDTENLERTVNQPIKNPGNPVLRREFPWEGFRVQVYGTVLFDPAAKLFKAWYMNIPKTADRKITVEGKERPGHATLLSYATSRDGIHWYKPVLDQVDFEGSKHNNMFLPEAYNPEGFSVLYEPNDPDPDKRYKAFYWDHGYGPFITHNGLEIYGSGPKDGMHVAFSPDGVHWSAYPGNPVMKYGSDTGQVVLFDPIIHRYVAYGRFGISGRKIARSESEDFIHWSTPELVLEPDRYDGPHTQFYGISVDLYQHVYIGMLWMFWIERENIGCIDFQLCHSHDGKHWDRDPDRAVFIPNGPEGAWDGGDMRAACRSVILNDRILIYYSGSAAPHGKGGELNIGMDIGVASLRRDGWVSLDTEEHSGILLTKPFVHPGGVLKVNVEAPEGLISARYLDSEGKPFPGSRPSKPLTGDYLDQPLPIEGFPLQDLEGQVVRLQFQLKNAKFYSFWFE